MPRTLLDTNQFDGVQRDDLDITSTGQAVVRKLVQGTGITLNSSGVDAGTGDVTVALNINGLTLDGSPDFAADYFVTYDADASTHKKVLLPKLESGVYTPTYTALTNISAITAYAIQYLRVGNTVTVSGLCRPTVTASQSLSEFRFTLPIASAITSAVQVAGTCAANGSVGWGGHIVADIANDEAYCTFRASAVTGTQDLCFSFSYAIL